MMKARQSRVFDQLADSYDASFTERQPARWLRSMVQERIAKLLPSQARILDIGCGTGEDAIFFANLGHTVFATDVSDMMLQQTRMKLSSASPEIGARVKVRALDAADPESAGLSIHPGLDLVFSNFGALNCVADLRPLFEYSSTRLVPGGYLAINMMGRYCAWETLGFAMRADFRRAFRRYGGSSAYSASGVQQRVWYPTVRCIRQVAPKNIAVCAIYGIGVLLPSSEFFGLCERWPKLFRSLASIERLIARYWPANRLGDHFLIVLRKKNGLQPSPAAESEE